ncbi:hypothetical protein [Pannonibacter phragmitetus]|uniref:hypothetical protein n=1 Tax=Pannonibacter phragmitetus TaxID=121719 RepID=UPI003D2F167D
MSLGFRRECLDQKDNNKTTNDRDQDDKRTKGAGVTKLIGIINAGECAVVEQIMDEGDKITEDYGTSCGNDANGDGDKAQNRNRKNRS